MPNKTVVMTMLGAEAVGKTTLLATMYQALGNICDNRQKGFALEAFPNAGRDLQDALDNLAAIINQPAFIDVKRLLPGTAGVLERRFQVLFKNGPFSDLSFYDMAGGIVMAEEEDQEFKAFKNILSQAAVIVNVIDGAALMEGSEPYNIKTNKATRITELLRPALANSPQPRLVLFVLTKCESWLKDENSEKQLLAAFEKRHGAVLNLLRGHENAVGVFLPVKTLGCVDFARVEEKGKLEEKCIFTRNPRLQFSPQRIDQPLSYALTFVLLQHYQSFSWWQKIWRGKVFREALAHLDNKCDKQFKTYGNFTLLEVPQ
ncbi:MAG: hypothetical protein BWK78_00650 [Thiotrichaceae bacterium IS1]|nr:MAG: hypothetical protein BWK78_00650 [Thiotrichaceae bacterium IS1]